MKTKYLYSFIIAFAALAGMQSCQKFEPAVFEESSSARIQNFNNNLQQILQAEPSGWVMDYYPGTGQSRGGYTFYMKFTMDTETYGTAEEPVSVVTAFSEINMDSVTSLYRISTDNGPVLTFDGNSDVLHYFATPSSSRYEALGGDFEFSVTSECSKDRIEMRGKRSGNICTLVPFSHILETEYAYLEPSEREKVTPEQYLSDVIAMSKSVRAATVEGEYDGKEIKGKVDLNNRRIKFTVKSSPTDSTLVEMPFIYTPRGIRAYEAFDLAGHSVRELSYFPETNFFTDYVISLQGKVPDDYALYSEFIGAFSLKYSSGTIDVTVVPYGPEENTAILKGVNSNFDLFMTYDSALGRMDLSFQVIGNHGSNSICWCPWDTSQGYLTKQEGVGLQIYLDKEDVSRRTFKFVDNGVSEDLVIDSFIVYELDANGGFLNEYTGFGTSRYVRLESLTRKY